MSIEFHCPGCRALIRVALSSGGKQGACPQCRTKLIIPEREGLSARFADPSRETPPEDFPPVIYFAPAEDPGPPGPATPAVDTVMSQPQPGRTTDPEIPRFGTVMTPRPRRRRKQPVPVIPIFFGVLLVAGVIWFVLQSKPDLTGTLSAEVAASPTLPNGLIGRADVPSSLFAGFDRVRDDLEATPLSMLSADELYRVEVRGVRGGLQVSVRPTAKGTVIKVRPGDAPELVEFVKQRAKEFNEQRVRIMQKHAADFIRDWLKVLDGGKRELPGMGEYQSHLFLPSMVTGFGYHVVAWDGTRAHPCLAVADGGELYFVVPSTKTPLTLRGRKIDGGGPTFDGEYVLKLPTAPAAKPSSTQPTIPAETVVPDEPERTDPPPTHTGDNPPPTE